MTRQFSIANIRQSADGQTVTADVVSAGGQELYDAADVRVISDDSAPMLRVRFPAHKLVAGSVLDLDR